MPTTQPEPDVILTNFTTYLHYHNITISPLITPHRIPGRGLGIRAVAPIPPGTVLIRMPTAAVVKWSDIPETFMPGVAGVPPPAPTLEEGGDEERDVGMRVHARLACWFAFSEEARERHGPWMETWPGLDDFESGMPGLWWPWEGSQPGNENKNGHGSEKEVEEKTFKKKRKPKHAAKEYVREAGEEESPPRSSDDLPFAILPPSITGRWATLPAAASPSSAPSPPVSLIRNQQQKFTRDLAAAALQFPQYRSSLLRRSGSAYCRFLHAWCCVNTRCFSYWPTWPVVPAPPGVGGHGSGSSSSSSSGGGSGVSKDNKKKKKKMRERGKEEATKEDPPPWPTDQDEAMAMCPFMDLFNHIADERDVRCCVVAYDEDGFTVRAGGSLDAGDGNGKGKGKGGKMEVKKRGIKTGDELFISYGAHGQDTLWVEYGFMLSSDDNEKVPNPHDSITLDAIILADPRLTSSVQARLSDAGYLGGYTLTNEGVCWRTETAARRLVMSVEEWGRFVEGTYADEHDEEMERKWNREVQGVMSGWVREVREEAERGMRDVEGLGEGTLRRMLGWRVSSSSSTAGEDEENVGVDGEDADADADDLASARKEMCLSRWREIVRMCDDVLEGMDGE